MNRRRFQDRNRNRNGKVFIVVAYDISDDRRRTRLHKKLKGFGTPVQYSVFECILSPKDLERMKKAVRGVIKEGEGDTVRYYILCEACRRRILTINGAVTREEYAVIV